MTNDVLIVTIIDGILGYLLGGILFLIAGLMIGFTISAFITERRKISGGLF